MGTNYYLRPAEHVCPHCKRGYEEIHIGKASFGWTFSFQGYRKGERDDNLTILSKQQWIDYLGSQIEHGAVIHDEYGTELSLPEMLSIFTAKRGDSPSNHAVYCRESHPEHAARDCWLDDDGESFSTGDFS